MLVYQHSDFSVDAGVCIKAPDRIRLAWLLSYCARLRGNFRCFEKFKLGWREISKVQG
jgi:hypothetical protein